MKRFFLLLLVCAMFFGLGSTAFAEVNSMHEEKINWNLTYPSVIIPDNLAAQDRINTDIMTHIKALRSDFENGEYYMCGGYYKVHYEDEAILSVSLYLYRYPYGANGNHSYSWNIVYDKTNGQKIPLYNYVRITPEDLDLYKYSHTYSESGELLEDVWDVDITKVPDDYFLPGDGAICIVFSPYSLTAGVYGPTYIKLEPEYIEYLNRKNK